VEPSAELRSRLQIRYARRSKICGSRGTNASRQQIGDASGRSCPWRWCKSVGHGLSSTLARAAAQAAAMRLGLACGSSLKASRVSRLM
jgi:hypothetical protein